jgi:hypothetical protein
VCHGLINRVQEGVNADTARGSMGNTKASDLIAPQPPNAR